MWPDWRPVHTTMVKTEFLRKLIRFVAFRAWKHTFKNGDQSGDVWKTSSCGQAKTELFENDDDTLYPIMFHSLWSFSLSLTLQSLHHVLSGHLNTRSIFDCQTYHDYQPMCSIYTRIYCNIWETLVAKAFSGFVWYKVKLNASNLQPSMFTSLGKFCSPKPRFADL